MNTDSDPLRILLVEDDSLVMRTTKDILQRLGYSVLTADSAREALAICTADEKHIDLMMTDMVMDEMNGIELRDRLQSVRPGIKVLFASGHSYDTLAKELTLEPNEHFIQKPYGLKELAQKLKAVVAEKRVALPKT